MAGALIWINGVPARLDGRIANPAGGRLIAEGGIEGNGGLSAGLARPWAIPEIKDFPGSDRLPDGALFGNRKHFSNTDTKGP